MILFQKDDTKSKMTRTTFREKCKESVTPEYNLKNESLLYFIRHCIIQKGWIQSIGLDSQSLAQPEQHSSDISFLES